MSVRQLLRPLLALALGVLTAVAVACGDDGDDRKLIAPSRAEAIKTELDTIAERVEKGECVDLEPAFVRLNREVDSLPASTDRQLRQRLAEGVANLEEVSPDECRDNRPETTPETTPETIPETTPETVPETTPETTTTPPETTTTPPETTTTPPETVPETVPPDSGGAAAPGTGFVPPGQGKGGKG